MRYNERDLWVRGRKLMMWGHKKRSYLSIFYITTTSCDFIFGQWG
jgi:hypothetical protein